MSPTVSPSLQVGQPTSITQPTATSQSASTLANNITPENPKDEDAMREALLRYRFGQVNLSSYPDSKYYCLGFETTRQSASNLQDPPQALIDRFQGNNPPVVKASECDMVGDNMDSKKVVFKNSGEQAIFWGLGNINWSDNNKASLELSYLYAFNGTGGSIFQLERQNGSWKVTGYTLTWIA
ncbi:MAG: hypothetical protein J0I20_01215 [Chloroflexi bacterium]|nr:hypothetical protein [Chloroflexota bacterium]